MKRRGAILGAHSITLVSLSLSLSLSLFVAMANVRYYVLAAQPDESNTWEHSYYSYAPAFFLARNPTAEEKLALVQELISRYTPRVLQAKPFKCAVCDAVATKSFNSPTYALHDPSCLAVNNVMLLVCEKEICTEVAHASRAEVAHKLAQAQCPDGVNPKPSPEVLGCRNCHMSGETPFPRCGRCQATLYCSTECQKVRKSIHRDCST